MFQGVTKQQFTSGLEALNHAMQLEISVTRSIKELIKTCENPQNQPNATTFTDYHVSHIYFFQNIIFCL